MKYWEDIGNTATARQLIAMEICTCKVAQYICEQMEIRATSYISDTYLEQVIEILWDIWNAVRAVSPLSLKFIHHSFS
jgi:hypothetical protein